jgi:hypothetical protein
MKTNGKSLDTRITFNRDNYFQFLNEAEGVIKKFDENPRPMKSYNKDVPWQERKVSIPTAQKFLKTLFPGRRQWQTFDEATPKNQPQRPARTYFGTLEEFQSKIVYQNIMGCCISFAFNKMDGKGQGKENVTEVQALVIDLDGAPLLNLTNLGLLPHAINETSPDRYQCFLRVQGMPREQFQRYQDALAKLVDADPQVEINKRMRVPGFLNSKAKRDKIYRSRVRYLRDAAPYSFEEIQKALPLPKVKKKSRRPSSRPVSKANGAFQGSPLAPDQEKIPEGQRGKYLTKRAGQLLHKGLSVSEVMVILRYEGEHKCSPPLQEADYVNLEHSVARWEAKKSTEEEKKVKKDKRIPFEWAPDRSRQLIRLVNRELPKSDEVFQRFGIPVVIRNVIPPSVLGFTEGVKIPMIITIEPSYLETLIEKHIYLYKTKDDVECPIGVPAGFAKKYIELPAQDLKLRPINLLLSCPTLDPEGKLIQTPGYDAKTGIYLLLKEKRKPINPKPSKAEAKEALARLLKLIEKFPFVREYHRSVVVAGMMTAVVRHCFRQAPAFASSAPMYATGKSLLMDIIALILTGKRAPAYNVSAREEEMDKFLISALICGINILSIDNFNSKAVLKSEALSSFLTQEEKMGRPIFTNKVINAPTCATVLVNGNNLTVSEDLTSRILVAKIDAKREHPERRKIELDLFEHIPLHRPEYVDAILTIFLYHLNCKKPLKQKLPRFGRFEKWSHWTRGSLVRLGMEDPYKALKDIREEDPDRNEKADFLRAGFAAYANNQLFLKDLITDAAKAANDGMVEDTVEKKAKVTALRAINDIITQVAIDKDGKVSVRALEKWLRPFKGRVIGGIKISPVGKKTNTGKNWQFTCRKTNKKP